MSSFKYHSSNNFCSKFYLFSCLHNVRHEISTIFMMLKTFSCADLLSRPLCWSIYWWIMWFLCGFEYIAKITTGYISRQWLEFVLAVREMSGKSQGFFFYQPVATLSNHLSYQGQKLAALCLWTLRWRYRCFWSKVNIWNVNCAWETAFIFDTQTDVLVTVSKFLRQKNVSTWEGLEPPTFRFMLNALTIWAIRARNLLSYVFEHLLWWYRYFWSKVNIWNVNCAWAAAFIFNTQTDVLMKVSKVFWDRKCLDLRETGTPNLPIHAECSNHLSYQGQFLPPRVSVLARLYIIAMSHECHGTSDHWHFDCSKLCITDISCRESTGDPCIPSTKGQQIIFIIRDLCVSQGLWHSGDIGHPDWAIDLVI